MQPSYFITATIMTNINKPPSFAVKSSGDQKITAWWQTPPRGVLSAGQAALRSLSFTNIPLIIYFPAVICSTCFGFKYKFKIIPEKPSEMCKHDIWHKYKSGNHFSRKLCAVRWPRLLPASSSNANKPPDFKHFFHIQTFLTEVGWFQEQAQLS